MNLNFDDTIIKNYHSNSQKARVLTENWMANNMFCPHCGASRILHFNNNQPVADFYCPICNNEYELKSKTGKIGKKITDGAYDTMIQRITSNRNPDFFLMNYSKEENVINDLFLIPKHFFVPRIIEKRKPLSDTARRAGWVGCNILLTEIPTQGRISIIHNRVANNPSNVMQQVKKSNLLITNDISARGWLFDILLCVNKIPMVEFSLSDVYLFENELLLKHPKNNNIRPKIRQQLQELRNRNIIEFLGHGMYKKIL